MKLARLLTTTVLVLGVVPANAESPLPTPRSPGGETLKVPSFPPADGTEPLALPPLPKTRGEPQLSGQLKAFIKAIHLEGNTIFSREELSPLIEPYENREITAGELQTLRRELTLYYIDHGYINSGVIIPDQDIGDSTVTLRVIEGKLSEIAVTGNKRLRTGYIKKRVALGKGPPLNIDTMRDKLQILQQNPRISRLNAALSPGTRLGESVLDVQVEEAQPYQFWIGCNNYRPPSIGSKRGVAEGFHNDVTGFGDTFRYKIGIVDGPWELDTSYAFPVSAYDTTFSAFFSRTETSVIETPFEDLDIETETTTFGGAVTQPFYLDLNRTFTLSLSAERRRNKSKLLGSPFNFSPAAEDGETKFTVIRFIQDWVDRRQNQVLAARSVFSKGINAFDATVNDLPEDGKFLAWLGQIRWAHRLGNTDRQVVFRTDVQLANDPLPPIEQFAIGGVYTVRGYRENRLVRDQGLVTSLELRIPILKRYTGNSRLQIVPFADYGKGDNHNRPTPHPDDIASAGIGLLWNYEDRANIQLYWGHPFRDFDNGDSDIQDIGIQFNLSLRLL